MIQHLGEKACSICASREAKEVDVVSRGIVPHEKLVKVSPMHSAHDASALGIVGAVRRQSGLQYDKLLSLLSLSCSRIVVENRITYLITGHDMEIE
jgi:hypothetical protein